MEVLKCSCCSSQKDEPVIGDYVCYCNHVTEKDICKAIDNGAQTVEAVIEINDRSVATSGNYRKFYVENGVKYSHTIDPKTGRPARNSLLSVTVVATDCMTADALATSFMVMGLEKGKELVKKLKGVEVLFIYSDEQGAYNTLTTEGMDKIIVEMAAK